MEGGGRKRETMSSNVVEEMLSSRRRLQHDRGVSDEKVPGTKHSLTIVSRILLSLSLSFSLDDPLGPIVSTELQFARCALNALSPPLKGSSTTARHDNEILIGIRNVSYRPSRSSPYAAVSSTIVFPPYVYGVPCFASVFSLHGETFR